MINNCIDCEKETTNGVMILTGKDFKYEYYCIMCARAFFSKLSKHDMMKLNKSAIQQCSYEYDSLVSRIAGKEKAENRDWSQVPMSMKRQLNSDNPLGI